MTELQVLQDILTAVNDLKEIISYASSHMAYGVGLVLSLVFAVTVKF